MWIKKVKNLFFLFDKLFLKKCKPQNILPLRVFSYLKGLNENVHLINQLQKGKILIYGKHLSGKKSLAHTILQSLKYQSFTINHKENESKNKFYELRLADKLLSTFKNSALIVENAEENYDLEKNVNLELDNSLQIFKPISPVLLFVIDLTWSIFSRVPPAVINIFIFTSFFFDFLEIQK